MVNVLAERRGKDTPVEFPSSFVDHWLDRAKTYEGAHPVPCDYCDDPIEAGDRFFTVHAMNDWPAKRGHVTHLKHAPPKEWEFDPARQQPQPWEADPTIPPPPGWEEWKRTHKGTMYKDE